MRPWQSSLARSTTTRVIAAKPCGVMSNCPRTLFRIPSRPAPIRIRSGLNAQAPAFVLKAILKTYRSRRFSKLFLNIAMNSNA